MIRFIAPMFQCCRPDLYTVVKDNLLALQNGDRKGAGLPRLFLVAINNPCMNNFDTRSLSQMHAAVTKYIISRRYFL
jgi:hypothetical protein